MMINILMLASLLFGLVASQVPSQRPTRVPTRAPTRAPTRFPSRHPTVRPTRIPTELPNLEPTTSERPVLLPTVPPTGEATDLSSQEPTSVVTSQVQTKSPARSSTRFPSHHPTVRPTRTPSRAPSPKFTTSEGSPTIPPTGEATDVSSQEPTSVVTSQVQTKSPARSSTRFPSHHPTVRPTRITTEKPFRAPTLSPTHPPTRASSTRPTVVSPSLAPTPRTWDYSVTFTVEQCLDGVSATDFNAAFPSCSQALARTVAEILPGVEVADVSVFVGQTATATGASYLRASSVTAMQATREELSVRYDVHLSNVLDLGYLDANNAVSISTGLLKGSANVGSFTLRLRNFAGRDASAPCTALNMAIVNASNIAVGNDRVSLVTATSIIDTVDQQTISSDSKPLNTGALKNGGVVLGAMLFLVLLVSLGYVHVQWRRALFTKHQEIEIIRYHHDAVTGHKCDDETGTVDASAVVVDSTLEHLLDPQER